MKCDLHIHSSYSFDSWALPERIVDLAIKKGLQCIAVSDHGSIQGSLEAQDYARQRNKPIIVIVSEEVKSKQGDILALNIKKPIPEKLSAKKTIDLIHKQNGIAVIPHPFGSWCAFKGNLQEFVGLIDGIETLNASVFWGNKKAWEFAQKNNLAFTAGSDAHFCNQFIGKVWLKLPLDFSQDLTADTIIAEIKNKTGLPAGTAANFIEKSLDHSFRSLTKLKFFRRFF